VFVVVIVLATLRSGPASQTNGREPHFRGRPASYWERAFKTSFDGHGVSYHNHDSLTELLITHGFRHSDDDLHDLIHGDEPERLPILARLLRDPDPKVRRHIAVWLGWMKKAPVEMVPPLIVAAGDSDPEVRAAAVHSLGSVGPEGKDAVPTLLVSLTDEDARVRREAIYALSQIGPNARAGVPQLIELLKSEDREVRKEAAHALGHIGGEEAKTAVPLLAAMIGDKEMNYSDAGWNALNRIDPATLERMKK